MNHSNIEIKSKGLCPICDREMFDINNSINKHHFIPKSRGGKSTEYAHRVCHDFLHKTWTNKELEREFSDPELIKEDPRAQVFIEWIQKKSPLFYISTKANNRRKGR